MKLTIAMFAAAFLVVSQIQAEEQPAMLHYNLVLECTQSIKLSALENIIPSSDNQPANKEEWVRTTINELEHIKSFLQSGQFKTGQVNFSIDHPCEEVEKKGPEVTLAMNMICNDSAGSEEIKTLQDISYFADKKLGYKEWALHTMRALQMLEMLFIKGKVEALTIGVTEPSTTPLKPGFSEVTCSLRLRGKECDEFQALVNSLANIPFPGKNLTEEVAGITNSIHQLQMLILSGRITFAKGEILIR